MQKKVKGVLEYLKRLNIDLPLFLDAFSWGHTDCRDDYTINMARVQLMSSKELPHVLERWRLPPKASKNTERPRAEPAFRDLAVRVVQDRI